MSKSLDFYFDFVSPYSFLAHKEIKKIQKKNTIKVNYKPILLGGLHNLHGITAPAFIPAKDRYMVRDCKIIAEKKKIKFKFNYYFPIKTVNLMRGVFISKEDEFENYYIEKIFDSIWKFGFNMNDQNIIEKVLRNIDKNPKNFFSRTSSQTIKNLLR